MSRQGQEKKSPRSTTTSARSATVRSSPKKDSGFSKNGAKRPKPAAKKRKDSTLTTEQHMEILAAVISDMRKAGSLPPHGWVVVGWAADLDGSDAEVIAMFEEGTIRLPGELVAGEITGDGLEALGHHVV